MQLFAIMSNCACTQTVTVYSMHRLKELHVTLWSTLILCNNIYSHMVGHIYKQGQSKLYIYELAKIISQT